MQILGDAFRRHQEDHHNRIKLSYTQQNDHRHRAAVVDYLVNLVTAREGDDHVNQAAIVGHDSLQNRNNSGAAQNRRNIVSGSEKVNAL